MCTEVGETIMTKNEALYKYLKMDYDYAGFAIEQDYKVLSYNRFAWALHINGDTYNFKPAEAPSYYPSKLTERVILKMVKLL